MRLIGWLLVVVIVGGGIAALVSGFGSSVDAKPQPIAFNHRIHIDRGGLTCQECHTDAAVARHPGLPGKQACLECHDIDDEQGKHPEKDKLFAYAEADRDIDWVRVALTKPDVLFSHRIHVGSGKLDCLVCHVGQPLLEKPPPPHLVMSMKNCIDCHEERRVSTDCLICHR